MVDTSEMFDISKYLFACTLDMVCGKCLQYEDTRRLFSRYVYYVMWLFSNILRLRNLQKVVLFHWECLVCSEWQNAPLHNFIISGTTLGIDMEYQVNKNNELLDCMEKY